MQALKIILGLLAAILALPLIFVLAYSVQAGCLLCLEGDAAGSAAEAWLNLGLIAVVLSALAVALWSRFAKRPNT